jgi:hypothetical protein
MYLIAITDRASRRVLSRRLPNTLDTRFSIYPLQRETGSLGPKTTTASRHCLF